MSAGMMSTPSGSRAAHRLSRRRLLVLLGVGTVATTGLGLAATRLIRSPQQLLADSAAPPRTVLTAPVERRVLIDTVVLRGLVSAGSSIEVTPAPAGAGRSVVTGVRVAAGAEFGNGAVLVEVSGRPLVALRGAVPAYRDLRPGMTGRDVAQLQQALKELGHNPGEADGDFGAGTKKALTALYDKLGYEVASTGDAGAVSAAADRVRQAERALQQAEGDLRRLRDSPPPTPGPGEPDPVAEAELRVRFAKEDLDVARTARSELVRTSGAMMPLSEVVFVPAFPARVEKLNGGVGAEVEAPLITVSTGALVVRATLNPAQQSLLRPQMAVEIVSELHGTTAQGVVSTIGEASQDETGRLGYPMTVTPTAGPIEERLNGSDVRLTVQAASTDGEVLVVPLSAVFAGADGRTAVLRLLADGSQERVAVTAGVSGDGYVAVTPAEGTLAAGDQVVVGAGREP